jgi:histidinol-phosphate/aromatic aminotransferase/cobyric acid decarboxylase-like protein
VNTPLEARQAIIEHNRMMKAQREWAAANRERLDAEWDALPDGRPWRIVDHIAGRKL